MVNEGSFIGKANLFASAALERICFSLRLSGSEGIVKILRLKEFIGLFSLLRGHVLQIKV